AAAVSDHRSRWPMLSVVQPGPARRSRAVRAATAGRLLERQLGPGDAVLTRVAPSWRGASPAARPDLRKPASRGSLVRPGAATRPRRGGTGGVSRDGGCGAGGPAGGMTTRGGGTRAA